MLRSVCRYGGVHSVLPHSAPLDGAALLTCATAGELTELTGADVIINAQLRVLEGNEPLPEHVGAVSVDQKVTRVEIPLRDALGEALRGDPQADNGEPDGSSRLEAALDAMPPLQLSPGEWEDHLGGHGPPSHSYAAWCLAAGTETVRRVAALFRCETMRAYVGRARAWAAAKMHFGDFAAASPLARDRGETHMYVYADADGRRLTLAFETAWVAVETPQRCCWAVVSGGVGPDIRRRFLECGLLTFESPEAALLAPPADEPRAWVERALPCVRTLPAAFLADGRDVRPLLAEGEELRCGALAVPRWVASPETLRRTSGVLLVALRRDGVWRAWSPPLVRLKANLPAPLFPPALAKGAGGCMTEASLRYWCQNTGYTPADCVEAAM